MLLTALLLAGRLEAATGGPDAGGYFWLDSLSGVPVATPGSISPATNLMPGFEGDGLITAIPLPAAVFPSGFPFYGQRYTTAYLSTEGWLSFIDPLGDAHAGSQAMPGSGPPHAVIAMLWDDIATTSGIGAPASGSYGPYGGGAAFGIHIKYWSNFASSVVDVVLFADGTIRLVYTSVQPSGLMRDATVGIENEDGSIGTQLQRNGQRTGGFRLDANFAVEFQPSGSLDCAAATPIACGDSISGASPATPAEEARAYACSGLSWNGNEAIYTFDNPVLQTVHIELTTGTDQALFLLDGCDMLSCGMGGSQSLSLPLLAPGSYWLVVDGRSDADNGPFGLSVNCAGAVPQLSCGGGATGVTAGASDVENWLCSSNALAGPEDFYMVDLPAGGHLAARLSGAAVGLEAIIFDPAGFDQGAPACLAGGATSVTAFDLPPGTYGVAVESATGTSGGYTLELGCGPQLDCGAPLVASCGTPQVVSGSTVGQPALVDRYACSELMLDGPEEILSVSLSQPATLYAHLESSEPGLQSVLLGSCDEGDCPPSGGGCREGLAPGSYTVAVDGEAGVAADYDLELWCFEPETLARWHSCEGTNNANQQPLDGSVTARDIWQFNDPDNYCPDGCDFAMYVVVECGEEFHLPFRDVESGHIRVYDILRGEYVELEAENNLPASDPNYVFMTGNDIQWVSDGCPSAPPDPDCTDINPGGCDERYNDRVMDVRFFGSPSVCGVYRMELLGWGGFVWDLFANCTGTNTPGFTIYSNICDALSSWNALPELQMTEVVVTDFENCPGSAEIEVTLVNTGCQAAVDVPIRIDNSTGDPPTDIVIPRIEGGATVVERISIGPFATTPVDVTVRLDPGMPGSVLECHEAGSSPVTCSEPASVTHERNLPACPDGCSVTANVSEPNHIICEGASVLLDGSPSIQSGCAGVLEYRWEAVGDPGQSRDWSTDPTFDVTPLVTTLYRLEVRCTSDLSCTSESLAEVSVTPNVRPARITSPIRAIKDSPADILWSLPQPNDPSAAGIRLYSSTDRFVDPLRRGLVAELGPSGTTHRESGVVENGPPLLYYQLVAFSCGRDLEGPY